MTGTVYLVGAGCGTADLITLRGLERLRSCDAIVYDALIDAALLDEAPRAERYPAGKRSGQHSMAQGDIERLLIALAREGKQVVRLKGGDPFLFGRGGEEAQALEAAGIPYEVVPGISSAIAIPELAGIPVTQRGLSQGLHILTAHRADTPDPLPAGLEGMAGQGETLVFLMGLSRLELLCRRLMETGMDPETPAAVLSGGCVPRPATVRGTLADLAARTRETRVQPPAVIVVGPTAGLNLLSSRQLPLTGVRVGLTGTPSHSRRLRQALEREGAWVVQVLRCAVVPLPCGPELGELGDGRARWLVFTSANGVEVFFRALGQERVDLRRLSACRFACVGPATARALEEHGILADVVPGEATTRALGETLRQAAAPGEEIWLLRSRQGSGELRARLEAVGPVRELALYQVETQPAGPLPELDWLTFSSAGGVEAFVRAFGVPDRKTRCLCIGPVTAAAARQLLGCPVLEAEDISAGGMVRTIRAEELRRRGET